ncbi:ompetence-damaged protein [Pseudomonas taiwanensis]|uniref:CinA family protein n=1 Tax=Pseudomonas taiwanensis TaxID=470150 RepID=UPI0015B98FC9|nr:CinA family protein [Pseudomonas taiwanensis]NWL76495.1 ompetence-damaged protein [Pseudomonas taiwanensis]
MVEIDEVVSFLDRYGLRLATAESCTAGLMASMLAEVSGSGSVLVCGFVVYAPEAKERLLGVNPRTIEQFGLTSEEVTREMAIGALHASRADIALANTGLAEADGEMDGVQCFACAMRLEDHEGVVSETVRFDGERNEVREAAARHALLNIPYYYERLRRT